MNADITTERNNPDHAWLVAWGRDAVLFKVSFGPSVFVPSKRGVVILATPARH